MQVYKIEVNMYLNKMYADKEMHDKGMHDRGKCRSGLNVLRTYYEDNFKIFKLYI